MQGYRPTFTNHKLTARTLLLLQVHWVSTGIYKERHDVKNTHSHLRPTNAIFAYKGQTTELLESALTS